MSGELVCWKCGAALQGVILPMSRREECPACCADQHVCKMCRHYAPQRAGQCTEDRAEEVADKERANFCDYFSPRENAFQGEQGEASVASADAAARAQLAELFGDEPPTEQPANRSPEDAAAAELERLLGGGDEPSRSSE